MPRFVIRATHSSDQCPTANSKTRDLMVKGAPAMPGLAQKLGVNVIVGPLILGAEHESITVVDADKLEAVDDFVIQSGMVQWNSVKVSSTMTMDDALKMLPSLTPLY